MAAKLDHIGPTQDALLESLGLGPERRYADLVRPERPARKHVVASETRVEDGYSRVVCTCGYTSEWFGAILGGQRWADTLVLHHRSCHAG